MQKFQEFEEWLKANHQLNWRDNILSMNAIEKILTLPDFDKISSVSILNNVLSVLRNNVSFGMKPKTERDKEIKAFKLYIQFKQEMKAKVAE